MPEAMRRVGDVLPLTHAVRALQNAWFGLDLAVTDLVFLAGMLVVAGGLTAVLGSRD